MTRRLFPTLVAVVVAASCTGDAPAPPSPAPSSVPTAAGCPSFVLERNDGECLDTFDLDDATYRVACVAVPELLLDVTVPVRWGGAAVRAIAAVPATHAVAVTGSGDGCGAHALALRTGLPPELATAIVEEVERAGSLPPDLEKEPVEPTE